MISAKEALEISKTNHEDVVQRQLAAVESCILEEIKNGKCKAYYRKPLTKNAIDIIKKMGYKVEKKFTTCNELNYVISWGNAERGK